jgi:hypothetical protein
LWCARIKRVLPGLALAAAGCFGEGAIPSLDDASYGQAPDLAPLCTSNNDGVIDRAELAFPVGLTVHYLENPAGTTVMLDTEGTPGPDGPEWDLTSTAGDVLDFTLLRVEDQWFASSFPGATYAVLTDPGSGTLGVYQVSDQGLYLLGFASSDPDRTLLVYDRPVLSLRFPVHVGDGWVSTGRIVGGKLEGAPFASTDTYRVTVDARGAAVMPWLRFTNTLRVRVEVNQALPAGIAVTRIQKILFHECYGELGRFVSNPGETDPAFSVAAEFRRLAL